MLTPNLRYALHPILPRKMGFLKLLSQMQPTLARLIEISNPYTLVSARNRVSLYRLAEQTMLNGIAGDFVEIGVHRGGSAAILAGLLKECDPKGHRTLHLFDRWGDLPDTTVEDGFRAEQYARANIPDKLAKLAADSPLESTREVILERVGFDRVEFHQGWYEDTFPNYNGGPIAFATVDCDYYKSVALTLDFIKEHAAPGCCVVIDDYDPWPGAKKATDEFATRWNLTVTRTGLGPAVMFLP